MLVALNSRLAGPQVHYVLEHCAATLLFIDAQLASGVGDAFLASASLKGVIEIADGEFGLTESGLFVGQQTLESFLAETDNHSAEPLAWEITDERAVISIN